MPAAGERWWRSHQRGGERSEPVSRIVFRSYDTESKSRNVLASPLGEEGHEVAKGWTVVRMIMILDVDVTAERRHYNTHRPLNVFAVHRFDRGAADWRSGPRWSILSVLSPVHPFPLRGTSPQGETRDMERKTGRHILQVPFRRFPLWWLAPPPCTVGSMSYDTESKSVTLALYSSPVRAIPQPSARRAVKLKNPWARKGPSILRTFFHNPSAPRRALIFLLTFLISPCYTVPCEQER